jgi:hypothetical protein
LMGSAWARAQANICKRAGRPVSQTVLERPREVQGVGNGSQTASYSVTLQAGLVDIEGKPYEESFTAPCLAESQIPGMMGIQSLKRNNALIECKTGKMWFLGNGGAEIKPSAGSRCFQMREAKSGHWLLPISKFSTTMKPKSAGMNLCATSEEAPRCADGPRYQ